jgi:hypothetical protein
MPWTSAIARQLKLFTTYLLTQTFLYGEKAILVTAANEVAYSSLLVSNARHARCNFQVAPLISEQQLSSLTYNLNLNQKMKKMKKSLPNKTTHFKTSNHVEIHTEIEDLPHDSDKILLTYQSSCKTISSHLYLYIQTPDEKNSMVYLKRVSFSLLILLIYHKESESSTPDLLTRSRTLAQTRCLRNQDLSYKHTTIKARNLFLLSHQQFNVLVKD